MNKNLAGIFTAISTTIAAPAFANDDQVFYTNPDLIHQRMAEIGCEPPPEKFEFERGKSWEEQTIPMPQQWTRNALIYYCEKNQNLLDTMVSDETSIKDILELDVEKGILALRSLPEHQKDRADELFREIAANMAREALDSAFKENLHKHRALPGYYNELSDILDQIEEAGNDLRALDPLHQRAYAINRELQERGFKNDYVYGAHAVAMSAAVGSPPDLMLDPEAPSENAAWVALNETYFALTVVIWDREEFDTDYGRDYNERKTEKVEDYTRHYFDLPEFGN